MIIKEDIANSVQYNCRYIIYSLKIYMIVKIEFEFSAEIKHP